MHDVQGSFLCVVSCSFACQDRSRARNACHEWRCIFPKGRSFRRGGHHKNACLAACQAPHSRDVRSVLGAFLQGGASYLCLLSVFHSCLPAPAWAFLREGWQHWCLSFQKSICCRPRAQPVYMCPRPVENRGILPARTASL